MPAVLSVCDRLPAGRSDRRSRQSDADSVGRNVQAPAGLADASQEAGDVVEERTERTEQQVFAPGPPRRHSSESFFPRNASVTARRRRNRRIALIATAVGVAVILAALYVLRRRRAQPPQEPEPPTRLRTPRSRAPSGQQQPSESEPPAGVPMKPGSLTLRFTCLRDTKVTFFGPSGRQHGFTALYDPSPSKRVATVDAGANGLFIGGGGMNGQFAKTLLEEAEKNGIRLTSVALSEHSQRIQQYGPNFELQYMYDPSNAALHGLQEAESTYLASMLD